MKNLFGFFKKKNTVNELAESAEIMPVAENGDYKAFLVKVLGKTENFSSAIQAEGGQIALQKFVEIIENRITAKDYEDIFSVGDQMSREYGLEPEKRNPNVERVLLCADSDVYFLKWSP